MRTEVRQNSRLEVVGQQEAKQPNSNPADSRPKPKIALVSGRIHRTKAVAKCQQGVNL